MKIKLPFALLIFLFHVMIISEAQQVWNHFNTSSGMVQNIPTDILIENEKSIWLTFDYAVQKFDYTTQQFGTIYTNQNGLNGQNYKLLRWANDRIWLVSDVGLTSIQGTAITNYNVSNGLLSSDIQDLAVDTNGHLWVASPQGVSHFNDSVFIHDTAVSAYQITIDDSNRVFILDNRYSIIFNNQGPFTTQKVLLDTGWTTPTVSGLDPNLIGLQKVRFKKVKDKIVVFSKDFISGYYQLRYPFHLDSVTTFYPATSSGLGFKIEDLTLSDNGKTWVVGNHPFGLFSTLDSVLKPHLINPEFVSALGNGYATSNGKLVILGSGNGMYIANESVQPTNFQQEISTGSIRTIASNYGTLFYHSTTNRGLFEIPKFSGKNSINEAYFIQAHKKSTSNAYNVGSELLNRRKYKIGPVSKQNYIAGEWLVKISKIEIHQHLSQVGNRGYVTPENIKKWFARGDTTLGVNTDLAPFVDVDQDGCYDPEVGDYPAIKGDEAIYWINHMDNFEYHYMLYAYNDTTGIEQTVFLDYTIINRDSAKYDSIKLGLFVDFDLGNKTDDYIGCDTMHNSFYVYNGDSFDEGVTGFGSQIPAVGVRFLSDSLAGFISFHNGNGATGRPVTTQGFINYLNAKWNDGVPLSYGSDGRFSPSNSSTNYQFSGNPLNNQTWSEVHPLYGQSARPPSDRLCLGTIPSFGLNLNERKTITVAIGYGLVPNSSIIGSSINELQSILNLAKAKYTLTLISSSITDSTCALTTSLAPEIITTETFKIFPNPSNGNFKLQFPANMVEQYVKIYTLSGKLIHQQAVQPGVNHFQLNLARGIYMIKSEQVVQKLVIND